MKKKQTNREKYFASLSNLELAGDYIEYYDGLYYAKFVNKVFESKAEALMVNVAWLESEAK
jgi:hypothetical protein